MASTNNPVQGFNSPIASPPPGITPNFINPESHGAPLIAVLSALLGLMACLFVMRMYTKIFIAGKCDPDDWACAFGFVGSIGYAATCLSMLELGVGVHIWDLLASRFSLKQDFFLRVYVIQVIVSPVMLAVKLSLLLLYLQLFRRNVTLRYWIYFGIAFLSTFYLACMLYHIILCTPRTGQTWYEASIAPRYFKRIPLGVAQGAVNVASDFYILFLPMRGVWQLQLPTRTKVGISAIFLSGFFACLSSTLGLVYRIKENQSKDKTWNLLPVLTLTTVEMSVGVMCSCMPAFARFFRHHPAFARILFSAVDLTLKKFHRLVSAISNRVTEKSSYSQMEKGDSSAPRQEAHHPNLGTGLRKAQEQRLGPSKLNLDEDSEAQHSEPALSQTVEVQTLKSQNSGIRIFQDWDVSSSEAQGSGPGHLPIGVPCGKTGIESESASTLVGD